MGAMRSLLSLGRGWWQTSAMTDEAVIDQVADLLSCGLVHIHTHGVRFADSARQSARGEATDKGLGGDAAPQTLRSLQTPAAPVRGDTDPSTFPSDVDSAAQAATLAAAADDGRPFCPT